MNEIMHKSYVKYWNIGQSEKLFCQKGPKQPDKISKKSMKLGLTWTEKSFYKA